MNEMNQITVLHFDDELDTVFPISVQVFDIFSVLAPDWLQEEEVNYDEYLQSLVIRPPGLDPLKIVFRFVETFEECKAALAELRECDIALFDLMCENKDGQVEFVGIDLYKYAKSKGIPGKQLFVLTGFPNLLEQQLEIESAQRLLKPTSPVVIAERLVGLLPKGYRPGDEL